MSHVQFTSRDGTLVMAMIEHTDAATRALLLEQCAPAGRDALKAALAKLDAREAAWREAATQDQRAIGWGHYFRVTWPQGFTVYGRVLTLQEFTNRSLRACGGDRDEFKQELRGMLAAYDRGWRYCDLWSQAEPDGDMPDDVHVAVMTRITEAEFGAARVAGWPFVPGGPDAARYVMEVR